MFVMKGQQPVWYLREISFCFVKQYRKFPTKSDLTVHDEVVSFVYDNFTIVKITNTGYLIQNGTRGAFKWKVMYITMLKRTN